ncbi:hypothetical protein R1flu_027424 [Riccia fluitans]|uniref:Uncharacterized protein n=1 Tax=Riccia fluitans TaxID=41844 RepID=A0ABD1XLP4_9MARC
MSKSVIIPLAMEHPPLWIFNSGCEVLGGAEQVTYLGCAAGPSIQEKDHSKDLENKLEKKLSQWSNCFFSWTSKVVLLGHVLRAIPAYQFLDTGLNSEGYRWVEVLCRIFLWGVSVEGKVKTPLIAWEAITGSYKCGGLQMKSFEVFSSGMKLHYISRILEGENSERVRMSRCSK